MGVTVEVHEALTALHGGTEGSDVVMKSISHVHQHEGDGPRLEQAGGRRASEAPPDHNNPHGIVHGHPGSHRTALKPGRGDQTRVNPAQPSRAADSRGLAPWSWGGGARSFLLLLLLLLALRLSPRRVESRLQADK